MKTKHPISITAAMLAIAASPALAAPPAPGPPAGPGAGPGAAGVLDQDYTLTSALALSSPGKTRTRTVHDPNGETHKVVTVRAAKAAGAVTTDLLTADGDAPGDLTATLKFTARSADNGDGSIDAILTVASDDGRLRMRLDGPVNDDGSYDADIVAARGKGSFAGIRVDGDADIEAADGTVNLDIDGEYEYGDDVAGPPAPAGPAPGPAGPPAPPAPAL